MDINITPLPRSWSLPYGHKAGHREVPAGAVLAQLIVTELWAQEAGRMGAQRELEEAVVIDHSSPSGFLGKATSGSLKEPGVAS